MELTWVVAASLVFVGGTYAFVHGARRSRFVWWTRVSGSLFALATRDLLRSRQQGRPRSESDETTTESPAKRTDSEERHRVPLFARLFRRVTSWLT